MVGWRRAPPSETTSKIKGRGGARESGQSASLIAPLARCAQRPHCDIRLRLFHRLMRRAPRSIAEAHLGERGPLWLAKKMSPSLQART